MSSGAAGRPAGLAGRGDGALPGSAIIREIAASGIDYIVSVPDLTTSEGLLRPLARGEGPPLLRVCREDEAVGIAAGLSFTGKRALILIQHTGLLDSVNALRAVGVEYSLPICMMVGLLQHEAGTPPRQSSKYGVRIVEPILDAMGVKYEIVDREADVGRIKPMIDAAYAASEPCAILISRSPAAS